VGDGEAADGVQLGVGGGVSAAGEVSVAGGEGEGVALGRVVDVSVGVKVGNGVRWGARRVG